MPQNTPQDTRNLGVAAALVAAAAGGAALFLASPAGKQITLDATARAEEWLARASGLVAQVREQVVSAVEDGSTKNQV